MRTSGGGEKLWKVFLDEKSPKKKKKRASARLDRHLSLKAKRK